MSRNLAMSEHFKANTDHPYFVTFTLQGWVDLFTRESFVNICLDSLRFCHHNQGLKIWDYVVMSNHLHLIIQHDECKLPEVFKSFKQFTANNIGKELKTNTQESRREWILRLFKYYAKYQKQNKEISVWKKTSKPFVLDTPDAFDNCQEYLHMNPVKAGYVLEPEHWHWSSACAQNPLKDILEQET
ncbi:MAG: REP-associated tyrosine transposase [Bacteroidia bacterium]